MQKINTFYFAFKALMLCGLILTASAQSNAPGERIDLTDSLQLGEGQFAQLFIPDFYEPSYDGGYTLIFHLHSASYAAENAIYKSRMNALLFNIHLGALSSPYKAFFSDTTKFSNILEIVNRIMVRKNLNEFFLNHLIITSFSAGYAGVREILKSEKYYEITDAIALADGLHGDSDSIVFRSQMKDFIRYAKDACDGRKVMLITHSSIPTEGYRSTTQTADYLIKAIDQKRKNFSVKDERGFLQTRCDSGNFHLKGYAGETADDHMRHLHSLYKMLITVDGILPNGSRKDE